MKKVLFIFIVAMIFSNRVDSQTMYFSTSYKQECWWNESSGKYENCTGNDESSLFKLNSEQTMFHHTTEKISSDYYVSKHEYDKDNDVYTYDVKSDAGNTYFFIIDLKKNQVRIVGNNKTSNQKTYMHIYTVKKSWTE